jgi:hypothetical protein
MLTISTTLRRYCMSPFLSVYLIFYYFCIFFNFFFFFLLTHVWLKTLNLVLMGDNPLHSCHFIFVYFYFFLLLTLHLLFFMMHFFLYSWSSTLFFRTNVLALKFCGSTFAPPFAFHLVLYLYLYIL